MALRGQTPAPRREESGEESHDYADAHGLGLSHIVVLKVPAGKNVRALTVDGAVGLVALDVLVAVLNHGDGQYNQQREHGHTRTDGRELWKKLQNDQH